MQMAHSASQSRVDAGVQFPSDVEAAWSLGEQVAKQIIEKATKVYADKQLVSDTIVKSNGRMNLPPTIPISKLADADKKLFLKYINQVKTIYLEYIRDTMSEKKLAEETLALVTKEYNIN